MEHVEIRGSQERSQDSAQLPGRGADGWKLVQVLLSGGAPWGFTLKGGREHGESLIISKIEEGSKAAAADGLLAGDEIISINDVDLSGFRQEAICLVKGSHKTLKLIVKSSSSHDLSNSWDQINLQHTYDHFGSQGSMDSLDHSSQTYHGRLTSARSNHSIDRLGNQSAHDSAYGSFSTSSSTPDHTLSRNDAASTETMIYKVGRWDTTKHGDNLHSQLPTDNKLEGKQGYSPSPIPYESNRNPRPEDHSDAKLSGSGRSNFGPVWHVPDKKKASYSPPPPIPPLRSDSFAATKGHEKNHGHMHPESTSTQHFTVLSKSQPKSEWSSGTSDYQQTYIRANKGSAEMKRMPSSADKYNNNVSNTNRLQSSLSSTDVRFAQSAYGYHHQRQHSDESTFFHNARVSASPKSQQDVTFHSSIKDQPSNRLHLYSSSKVGVPGALSSANIATTEQNTENIGPSRYYCVTAKQQMQGIAEPAHTKAGIRKAGDGDDIPSALPENSSTSTVIQTPTCYLPQQHDKSSLEAYEKNGYLKLEGRSGRSAAVEDLRNSNYIERTSTRNEKQRAMAAENRCHQKDLSSDEESIKISPQSTPMLHSLAQEGKSCLVSGKERWPSVDALMSKQPRRNDRYATALRNEIQVRRARLQKSQSTVTLFGPSELEEHTGNWKSESTMNLVSPSESSLTNTYKDHLKEAQARVLKATSFKRRDLEPGPSDHPSDYRTHNHRFSTSPFLSEDASGLSESTQMKLNLSGSRSQHVLRIGGRKRFTAEQKLKSYSEPEKMNEVGISENHRHHCPDTSENVLASFADRWKFFEETSKSTHKKPVQKPTPASIREERPERLLKKSHGNDTRESWQERRVRAASLGSENILDPEERARNRLYCSGHLASAKSLKPEQSRRLGTFAEYQASWKDGQKLLETKSCGRYHSADNILDAGLEQYEKPQYRHERSQSSPSTDYHASDDSAGTGRRQTGDAREDQESVISENSSPDTRSSPLRESKTRYGTDNASESGDAFDQNLGHERRPSQTREPLVLAQESRARSGTLPSDYRYPPESKECNLSSLISSEPHDVKENRSYLQGREEDSQRTDQEVSSKKRGPAPQRPPPPKLDNTIKYKRPVGPTSSPGTSSNSVLTVPGQPPSHSPSVADVVSGHLSVTGSPAEQISTQPQEHRQTNFLENEKQYLKKTHLTSDPSLSLKHRFLQKSGLEMSRSPSPQFAPQKLTDKPPVSLQDENLARIERVIGKNTTVKMVPIKIVHSESHAEKENRQNLLSNIEPPALPVGLEKDQIKTLSTSEQSYSRFCAYTRLDPEQDVENQSRAAGSQQANSPENILKDCNFSNLSVSYVKAKEKTLEDLKSEELAREIIGKDKSLADILDPNVKLKTAMDLMVGIFPKDDQLLEDAQQRRKLLAKVPSPKLTEEKKEEQSMPSAISLTTSSTYYSTSAPKAELLIKMKDMQQQQQAEEDSEEELDHDLSEKKQELIDSISRKLQVLREARETLLEDIQANNVLGDEVEAIVKVVCKPNEFDKFRMFIGDLDKVVNLLLSLSGRLARVENALNNLDESASPEERRTLVEKQKLLTRQHEDAKELKENLDRRERIVFDILASYLSEENLADYEHFVKMKSALIIEQRELEDKIKLGEEQLKCLTDSLPLDRTK
ncbi:protein Shroom2 isoform X2 [Microcaecilia unicolor]|uniref:Protein Shroom2 isoform X2 n=1 Tax=Microcaecilia unicolor TaxID=1415580 RepID=A0A6P7XWY3_9AMPH|nr:protein Shroom2 isoform X2 [Microcaecilia unicolor]